MSALIRFKKRTKRINATCPICNGLHVELIGESREEGFWRKEEYFCRDCECEWDWTYRRPFSRPHLKIRPPRWAHIE